MDYFSHTFRFFVKILAIWAQISSGCLDAQTWLFIFPGIRVQVLNQLLSPTVCPLFLPNLCHTHRTSCFLLLWLLLLYTQFPFHFLAFCCVNCYLSFKSLLSSFLENLFSDLWLGQISLVLLTVSAANIHVTFEWSFINCLLCCILAPWGSGIWVGAACHSIPSTEGPGTHLNYF